MANPLRGLAGDAACVHDVITSIGGPVVLAGHSYGGVVITEGAAGHDAVTALVYVCAFAPDIPVALHRLLADRAHARAVREIAGA